MIRFSVDDRPFVARVQEPVTIGVPFPKGRLREPDQLSISDAAGHEIPIQTAALDRWSDGSIRWLLVDFQAGVRSLDDAYALDIVETRTHRVEPKVALTSRVDHNTIEIQTGPATFRLTIGSNALFHTAKVGGVDVTREFGAAFSIEWPDGPSGIRFDAISIEEHGPLRTVVLLRGHAMNGDSPVLDIETRVHFFAGSGTVRIVPSIRNSHRAQHPGGFWELGDSGSIYIRDFMFHITCPPDESETEAWCSEDRGCAPSPIGLPFELYQESSGGRQWNHPNHRNRFGVIPVRWRGYRCQSGDQHSAGERATPIVGRRSRTGDVAVTLPHFWQNFPKAIESTANELILRLFPRQLEDQYELQGGEQKTHAFYVAFGADTVTPIPLDWCRAPVRPMLTPSWYATAQALPYLTTRDAVPSQDDVGLVAAAIDATQGFVARREVVDEYGWRNFGDLYADHEAALDPGSVIVSHYNNQYDAVAGFARQFMRSADGRWWELMDDLARHVVDIDIYRTNQDKSAYNSGLFWHTVHYVDAGLSTHRSYPNAAGVDGGGPSNEHNYTTGLLLHYLMTGSRQSREAVIILAEWVIAMDDGRQSRFRWISSAATGLASQTRSPDYHGPGRGAGHSIRALLDGHRLAGDARFLHKAEELIRRVIHPDDNIDGLTLLDAEQRWSYTIFLQILGGYLEHKAERGEFDFMYGYARASLLRYAAWMATYERPYLDRPEALEYPTETWAAQDIRKSDVFYFAARHSGGADRGRFLERGAFFFRVSLDTLAKMPTRALTRPLVILLSNGALHAWAVLNSFEQEPHKHDLPDRFGPRQRFVPQKERVKRRLTIAAGLGAVFLGGLAAFLLFRLV